MDWEVLRGRPSWLGVGKGDFRISLSNVGLCEESVLLVPAFECDESIALFDELESDLVVSVFDSDEPLSLELRAAY